MSIFSKMKAFCRACGTEMLTDFQEWGGQVCSRDCWQELQWRQHLSILGKPYKPDPRRCQECKGSGTVEGQYWHAADETEIVRHPCRFCNADALRKKADQRCQNCFGKGWLGTSGSDTGYLYCHCALEFTGRK